jgi:hypothetical protein
VRTQKCRKTIDKRSKRESDANGCEIQIILSNRIALNEIQNKIDGVEERLLLNRHKMEKRKRRAFTSSRVKEMRKGRSAGGVDVLLSSRTKMIKMTRR